MTMCNYFLAVVQPEDGVISQPKTRNITNIGHDKHILSAIQKCQCLLKCIQHTLFSDPILFKKSTDQQFFKAKHLQWK